MVTGLQNEELTTGDDAKERNQVSDYRKYVKDLER
jgi:hypothetical protein